MAEDRSEHGAEEMIGEGTAEPLTEKRVDSEEPTRSHIRQAVELLEISIANLVDACHGKIPAPTRCRIDEQRITLQHARLRILHIVQGTELDLNG